MMFILFYLLGYILSYFLLRLIWWLGDEKWTLKWRVTHLLVSVFSWVTLIVIFFVGTLAFLKMILVPVVQYTVPELLFRWNQIKNNEVTW